MPDISSRQPGSLLWKKETDLKQVFQTRFHRLRESPHPLPKCIYPPLISDSCYSSPLTGCTWQHLQGSMPEAIGYLSLASHPPKKNLYSLPAPNSHKHFSPFRTSAVSSSSSLSFHLTPTLSVFIKPIDTSPLPGFWLSYDFIVDFVIHLKKNPLAGLNIRQRKR